MTGVLQKSTVKIQMGVDPNRLYLSLKSNVSERQKADIQLPTKFENYCLTSYHSDIIYSTSGNSHKKLPAHSGPPMDDMIIIMSYTFSLNEIIVSHEWPEYTSLLMTQTLTMDKG